VQKIESKCTQNSSNGHFDQTITYMEIPAKQPPLEVKKSPQYIG